MTQHSPLADHAEYVALGVGQDYPAEVVAELVPTDLTGPGRRQSRHFGINIGRTEVEVHPVFPGRGIGHLLESEPGPFQQGHRGELVGEQFLGRATELLGPPAGQLCRMAAVEGDHLYVERHTARPYAVGDKNAWRAAEYAATSWAPINSRAEAIASWAAPTSTVGMPVLAEASGPIVDPHGRSARCSYRCNSTPAC